MSDVSEELTLQIEAIKGELENQLKNIAQQLDSLKAVPQLTQLQPQSVETNFDTVELKLNKLLANKLEL